MQWLCHAPIQGVRFSVKACLLGSESPVASGTNAVNYTRRYKLLTITVMKRQLKLTSAASIRACSQASGCVACKSRDSHADGAADDISDVLRPLIARKGDLKFSKNAKIKTRDNFVQPQPVIAGTFVTRSKQQFFVVLYTSYSGTASYLLFSVCVCDFNTSEQRRKSSYQAHIHSYGGSRERKAEMRSFVLVVTPSCRSIAITPPIKSMMNYT